MFYRPQTGGGMLKPVNAAAQPATIPASVGGVNALDPLIALPVQDCYYTFNLMPSEYGLRLRKGYRTWASGVGTAPYTDVRSIVPFQGTDPANDKLFAVTADGIYDVTTDGTTNPTAAVAFGINTGDAGIVTWTEFTNDAAVTFLFVACPKNGLHQYTVGGGWVVPTITGVTVADVGFVVLHKQRLWLGMQNSTDSFYSPVAAVAGAFVKFVWGSKFTYGGKLLGMYTWTLDGGNGLDDYFVGVSRGGDVLVYRGSDPSDANTWELTGSFFVGEMPNSRRVVEAYAAELYILSTFGVTSLRDLVSGVSASDTGQSPSSKINRVLRAAVVGKQDEPGWQMCSFPPDGFLQIIEPFTFANKAIQYSQNLLTKAWGYWRDVPMLCAETWKADFFMGAQAGEVWLYTGVLDGSDIDGLGGEPIGFSILTSFQPYGEHGFYKRIGLMRVVALSDTEISYNLKAVYDYNITAEAPPPTGAFPIPVSLWDSGIWDLAVWGGESDGRSSIEGAAGIGRVFAIAMRGEAASRLTIIGWDITFTTGGFL